MLLGTLAASLLGDMTAGKGIVRAGYDSERKKQLELAMDLKDLLLKNFLTPSPPVTNFEIQKYYQNEPRFSRVYSRDNLPNKIKDGAYV